MRIALLLLLSVSMGTTLPALAQSFENSGSPATVVELFTSEGCSSCPSAEAVLNQLKESDGLWTQVIPMAFHVDYWNDIGWPDRFSKPDFSQRQRQKVSQSSASGVYTPGWFINDQEWRGFFARQSVPYANGPAASVLKASVNGNTLRVDYAGNERLNANFALLAMGLTTEVKRGENRGKTLEHEFVVVDFDAKAGQRHWQFVLDEDTIETPSAIAVWLTPQGGGDPIQTVAGWLEP
ncbi:hypothetical protein A1OK_19515 [Enterovibrio norvegicus FF-454]|uniref:DUF1223 domain-containing protein n=1 Tax=Enterovibrio norvegicus FF-454 TaxID=1185651 RepID=A0A1E5CBH6_9GAMM|nr:DUF1223 domain-containing protein [Enterovibrio norvegicus]OEE62777.1 hypothetical protein A1OK_19515 [Enterovibrio norvegicus FF-454]